MSANGRLDVVETANAIERLSGQRGTFVDVDVVELAPDVDPARDLQDRVAIEFFVAGVAVGLQDALGGVDSWDSALLIECDSRLSFGGSHWVFWIA